MANVISGILGVRGYDLATRRANVVTPANFSIGGLMGHSQRKYAKAIPVSSPTEFQTIFGGYFSSAAYAPDVVEDFFNNLAGTNGQLYFASYVGNNAGTIDAVVASLTLLDTRVSPASCLTLQAGYNGSGAPAGGLLQYGADGNKTGITVVTGNRFSTTVATSGVAVTGKTGDTTLGSNQIANVTGASSTWAGMLIAGTGIPSGTVILSGSGTTLVISQAATASGTGVSLTITQITFACASVADIEVGDAVTISWSGGSASSGGYLVASVNGPANTFTVSGSGLAAGNYVVAADAIVVPGFQLHTWRIDSKGVVQEVDTDLGSQWCTYYSGVSHYVGTVFARSNYLVVSVVADAPTNPVQAQPAAIATVTYLAGGADGTTANTAASWAATLALFDNLPVRFLANCETSAAVVQVAGETYCYNRWDSPAWLYLFSANQSLAQLQVTGQGYQRGGKVSGIAGTSTWGYKSDPYNPSPVAPYRAVPSVGAVMGLAVRVINKYGIHYTYGLANEPIVGWQDVYGYQALADTDRTTLARAGVNTIQNLSGSGIVLRNSLTPSTTVDYLFSNALMMTNYIKVSCQGSLQATENYPLTYAKLQADRSAIDTFMRLLWSRGSNGNVPEGETFGQTITQTANGAQSASTYEQSVSVEANLANNPQSSLSAGSEQVWVYFMRPAPAQSIRIGVGIQLAA